jgi:hypothetical protein
MSETPWWGSLLLGVSGGVLALGGHWLTHLLTTKREDAKRWAEKRDKERTELKAAYVAFMNEMNDRDRKTAAFAGQPNTVTPAQIWRFLQDDHLRASGDVYFKLRMLETDPEGIRWIKKLDDADQDLLNLFLPMAQPTGAMIIDALNKNAPAKRGFQEWLFAERFHPDLTLELAPKAER